MSQSDDKDPPRVPYWHVWTDDEGVSRQTRCSMSEFELKSIGGGADPQWQGLKHTGSKTVMVSVLPVGWVGQWHENPKPQWVIPLSGRWFVETMDGQRVEMGPGDVSFGEDQGTRERDGRKGHLSGTVGEEPCALMMIQFEEPPELHAPCRFR